MDFYIRQTKTSAPMPSQAAQALVCHGKVIDIKIGKAEKRFEVENIRNGSSGYIRVIIL